jgi:peptidyl-prolyl cis-trans isomerase C
MTASVEQSSRVHRASVQAVAASSARVRLGAALRGWAARGVREPFVHFLMIGLAVSAGIHYWQSLDERFTIHVDTAERELLESKYQQQYGERPNPGQIEALIAAYVREEIFVREAVALHLDQDDEIIRRRLAQKYEFLRTDLGVAELPDADTLAHWYAVNRQRYLLPPRVALSQVYFAVDAARPEAARQRALGVEVRLRQSQAVRAPELGDAFPGPTEERGLTPNQAVQLFGDSELSDALFRLPPGIWSGPYRSGYGWHLVYLTERLPESLPSLPEVRDRVIADYLDERRAAADAERFAMLRTQYHVRLDDGPQ